MSKIKRKAQQVDDKQVLITEKNGKEFSATIVKRNENNENDSLGNYSIKRYEGNKLRTKKLFQTLEDVDWKETDSQNGANLFYEAVNPETNFEKLQYDALRAINGLSDCQYKMEAEDAEGAFASLNNAIHQIMRAARRNNPSYDYVSEGLNLQQKIVCDGIKEYIEPKRIPSTDEWMASFAENMENNQNTEGLVQNSNDLVLQPIALSKTTSNFYDEFLLQLCVGTGKIADTLDEALGNYGGDMNKLIQRVTNQFGAETMQFVGTEEYMQNLGIEYLVGDSSILELILPNITLEQKGALLTGLVNYFDQEEQNIISKFENEIRFSEFSDIVGSEEIYQKVFENYVAAHEKYMGGPDFTPPTAEEMNKAEIEQEEKFLETIDLVMRSHGADEESIIIASEVHETNLEFLKENYLKQNVEKFEENASKEHTEKFEKEVAAIGNIFRSHSILTLKRLLGCAAAKDELGKFSYQSTESRTSSIRVFNNIEANSPRHQLKEMIMRNPVNALLYNVFQNESELGENKFSGRVIISDLSVLSNKNGNCFQEVDELNDGMARVSHAYRFVTDAIGNSFETENEAVFEKLSEAQKLGAENAQNRMEELDFETRLEKMNSKLKMSKELHEEIKEGNGPRYEEIKDELLNDLSVTKGFFESTINQTKSAMQDFVGKLEAFEELCIDVYEMKEKKHNSIKKIEKLNWMSIHNNDLVEALETYSNLFSDVQESYESDLDIETKIDKNWHLDGILERSYVYCRLTKHVAELSESHNYLNGCVEQLIGARNFAVPTYNTSRKAMDETPMVSTNLMNIDDVGTLVPRITPNGVPTAALFFDCDEE